MEELSGTANHIAIDKQILLLENIVESPEKQDDFFFSPMNYSYKNGVVLSPEVITILSNSTLFDNRFHSYISRDFWIEGPTSFSHPVIYKADPTIAFALGALFGKALAAAAVGAGGAAGVAAVRRK